MVVSPYHIYILRQIILKQEGQSPPTINIFITKHHYLLKHDRNHLTMIVISAISNMSYSYTDIICSSSF